MQRLTFVLHFKSLQLLIAMETPTCTQSRTKTQLKTVWAYSSFDSKKKKRIQYQPDLAFRTVFDNTVWKDVRIEQPGERGGAEGWAKKDK